jgi:hypothetical protein
MKSVDIHEWLKVCGSPNNLVDGSIHTCEMVSVGEKILVTYNRHNMLVHMAELVVWITKDNPHDVFHWSVSRLDYK